MASCIRDSNMQSSPKSWTEAGRSWQSAFQGTARSFLLLMVGIYRTVGTSHLGGACRFEPSCSAYAVEALNKRPVLLALKLILIRLSKCRPGGPYGYDPVPVEDQENRK